MRKEDKKIAIILDKGSIQRVAEEVFMYRQRRDIAPSDICPHDKDLAKQYLMCWQHDKTLCLDIWLNSRFKHHKK